MDCEEKSPFQSQEATAPEQSVHAVAGIELFHSIPDPVLIVTPEGVIVDINRATLKAAGKSRKEIIGKGVCQVIHGGRWPHIECPLEAFLRTCRSKSEDTKLPGLGGEYHLTVTPLVDDQQQVRSIMLQARQLTREEVSKVETIRTAQLASLGELAAGVAHEINNPINGIINFAQLMLDDGTDDNLHRDLLKRIVKEGERIAVIIESLLSFAREHDEEFSTIDFRDVVTECMALVDHQLRKEGIGVELEFSATPCLVVGNFTQLQQVIFNTINNSRYALNERYPTSSPNKKIIISCTRTDTSSGPVVRSIVRDLGTGIPQGILDKLFDPFFTSKPKGQGTGLGLSISFGIIQNHGGTLLVDSMLNQYTDMIIEIPAAQRG